MVSKNNPGSFNALLSRLVRDESGAELVEAVLVIGLIAIICIAATKGVSSAVAWRWNQLLDVM